MSDNEIVVLRGNPNIKNVGVNIEYTAEQIQEYVKCAQDPIYFIENYCKVVSLDNGIVPFKMYDYQKRIVKSVHENRFTIAKLFRQAGKSTILAAYVLWYATFNTNKTACILANKQAIAIEILGRVQYMHEMLPNWLKQGASEWNKKSFKFENGSRVFCAATSPSSVRGNSISLLVVDEFGFLPNTLADEFIASVFPTLSSSKESKIVLISTPNGMNHFAKMWLESEQGLNNFVRVEGKYQEARDEQWAQDMYKLLGKTKYNAEILCQFAGSSATLVDGEILYKLPFVKPVKSNMDSSLQYFEPVQKDHQYVMTVDISRGRDMDYSAFIVFDVSTLPYKVVCTFKNNEIGIMKLSLVIAEVGKLYNDAYLFIENNDLGESVCNDLWFNQEYENLIWTKSGKISGAKDSVPGIRTTKSVKTRGCSAIKEIIEKSQLIVNDYRIIEELGVYVQNLTGSYAAQDTHINDDLCSCLFLFGYFSLLDFFKDLSNTNVSSALSWKYQQELENDVTPIGFFPDSMKKEDSYRLNADEISLLRSL